MHKIKLISTFFFVILPNCINKSGSAYPCCTEQSAEGADTVRKRLQGLIICAVLSACLGCGCDAETADIPEIPAETVESADMLTDAVAEMLLQTQETVCVRLASGIAWDIASDIRRAQQRQVLAGTMLRTVSWTQDGDWLTVTAEYTDTPEAVRKKKSELAEYAQRFADTAKQYAPEIRVLLAHDLLINRCAYASDTADCHSAYGALLEAGAVCDGYAEGFALLLETAQIPVQIISGTVRQSDGNAVSHAWNLVALDGAWYHADCTRDDRAERHPAQHDYFLRTDADMQPEYIWDTAVYPAAEGTAYRYADIVQQMQVAVRGHAQQMYFVTEKLT